MKGMDKPFDRTLKAMLGDTLLQVFGYQGSYREIPSNLPIVRERAVDRLFLVEGPRRCLVHVEYQSTPDRCMPERMVCCMADIWYSLSHHTDLRGLDVDQFVVYVGQQAWQPHTEIVTNNLSYRYHFVDMKGMDPGPFIESKNLDGVIFAVLCRDGSKRHVLREVLKRIKAVPESERPDIVMRLTVLCDLRDSGPLLTSEMRNMGLTFNPLETTLVREAIKQELERVRQETAERVRQETAERVRQETAERVRQETAERVRQEIAERVRHETAERVRQETAERLKQSSINNIVRIMRSRFNNDLPSDLRPRLQRLTSQELDEIIVQAATAPTAEAALDIPPDASASISPP